MHKNACIIYGKTEKAMSDFCNETRFLPGYTPMFICDDCGRILQQRKLDGIKDKFFSVGQLIDEKDRAFYLSERETSDCMVMHTADSDEKDFVVISKSFDNLSKGVVCSYSEKNCIKLNDYFEKLCSYKDYLDTFTYLSFSSDSFVPALKIFDIKSKGVSMLLELAFPNNEEISQLYAFPLNLVVRKLTDFVINTNSDKAISVETAVESDERSALVPFSFLKALVSCISLVIRYSKNGHVGINIRDFDENSSIICIQTSYVTNEKDGQIYEKAVSDVFENMGFVPVITKNEGVYRFEILVNTVIEAGKLIAESDELLEAVTTLFSEETLSYMCKSIII